MKKSISIVAMIFIAIQITLAINPVREYKMRPEKFNLKYEEIRIETPDHFELNAWIMQPLSEQKKNVTIVVVGSDAGNMGFSLAYVYHLLREGYQVVTFDYRGFGSSSDFDFNPNFTYHSEYITDFVATMNWCEKHLEQEKIGVLSFSMGTFISAVGYSSHPYDFYIGEGFLKSPKEVLKRLDLVKGKEFNVPSSANEDEELVEKLAIPILIFAASLDKITLAKDSHDFCDLRPNATVIDFEGDHFEGAITLGMPVYIREIVQFIDEI